MLTYKQIKLYICTLNKIYLERIALITLERNHIANHVSVSNFNSTVGGLRFRARVQTYSCEKLKNLTMTK